MRKGNFKHGFAKDRKVHRFLKIWYKIQERCNLISYPQFYLYGGRGIKCLWKSFEEFRDDMYKSYQIHIKEFGEKQTQIDRIDNNGHYCKENCRWVTIVEQARNKRNVRRITFNGKNLSVPEWAEAIGIGGKIIRQRIDRQKWSIEKTLTTPTLIGSNQFSYK